MFKRLAIVLVVVGLVSIFIAESANAIAIRLRRSVGVTLISDNPGTFVTSIFGFPGDEDDEGYKCGEVLGELYCASNGTEEARLACDIATGDSAARVLVLDKEAIRDGVPPNFFTKDEVNFFIKDRGQREQLKGFETRARSTDPAVYVISLPTGKKNNAGFHALTDESLAEWKDCGEGCTLSDSDALRRFVGTWDSTEGKFIPDDGFGINGEEFIHKVPGVEPLFGPGLDVIVGETICAVVKHSQVKGNTLKGPYLGLAALKVLSRSGSLVEVEVLDADDVCGLPLYIKTPSVVDAVPEGEGQCLVSDATVAPTAIVFAPGFPDGELREGEGKFPAVAGELEWDGDQYKQTVEIKLDDTVGQALCEKLYQKEDYPDVTFVDFIPVNRGSGLYADYAFIGLTESENTDVADLKKCKEGVEGGSRFNCEEDYEYEIPTCSFNCGNNFPGNSGDYEDFLMNVVFGDSYNPADFVELTSFNFEGEWDFKTIGLEAGHALVTERGSGETEITLYDSEDCASWGLKRRVDFSAGENLVFVDTNTDPDFEVALNPYAFGGFSSGNVGNNIYIVQYNGVEEKVVDYLPDPFTVKPGQYFIFFNDFDPSADYDDFILIGNPVSLP